MMMSLLRIVGLDKYLPSYYNWVTVDAANKLLENNQVLMIDVRTKAEWEATGIPFGSHCVELQNPDFLKEISKLCDGDKTTGIALSCLSGHRSKKATRQLKSAGYNNLVCVEGGIIEWTAQNLPVQDFNSQEMN